LSPAFLGITQTMEQAKVVEIISTNLLISVFLSVSWNNRKVEFTFAALYFLAPTKKCRREIH
jgi:hypothetical protein